MPVASTLAAPARSPRRPRRVAAGLAVGAALLTPLQGALPASAATATSYTGSAPVGPLFLHGLSRSHTCNATVISSSTHDVLLTAAHCITGTGAGIVFAPDYRGGRAPYGTWTVQHAYVDPMWKLYRDRRYDYALLVVGRQAGTGRHVQNVTNGYALGVAQPSGTTTTLPAYKAGIDDWPVRCTTRITHTSGYPTFSCGGYPDGTSGAPFIVGSYVTGVIGGLHLGGCTPSVSYSAPFSASVLNSLYLRATRLAAASYVPAAGSDGC